jgi:hypothetical protein
LFSRRAESGRIAKRQPIFADAEFSLDLASLDGAIERPRDLRPQYEVVLAVGRSKRLPAGAASSCGTMASSAPQVTASNLWQCVALNFALPSVFFPYRLIDRPSAALWLKRKL